MNQKRIRITIDTKGGYGLEALEGFVGTSCVEQTRELEVAIGGMAVEEGKTDAFYDSDGETPVFVDL